MFLIAPKSEADGEAVMSVAEAKKQLAKWETLNRLRPNAQNALNLACIYYTLGEGDKALSAVNAVVEAIDGHENIPPALLSCALLNRGMFLRGFGRFTDASADIKRAWKLDKTSAYCGMAYAEENLREGNWREGWRVHNQVRGTFEGAALAVGLTDSCKAWDGKEHPEHLIVVNEGGAGDRINYTRFLPMLTERGIKWSFFCFDEFYPFYERLPWIGKDRIIRENEKREFSPAPSHWTTTFALPGPLAVDWNSLPDFPSPYLGPASHLGIENPDGKPIVGLAWSANELFQGGLKVRSMTEGQAARLACMTIDKVHWVNLQHGHKMPFPFVNVPFQTWQDTAAVINALDAVATVDCGTLWLSTAMNKPTAIVLSSSEDWKFSARKASGECAWSPAATLYHNGESANLFDIERAIDLLIMDIRSGKWPKSLKQS